MIFLVCSILWMISVPLFATLPQNWSEENALWTKERKLSGGFPRSNIYELNPQDFVKAQHQGQKYALSYPVNVTGLLIPYDSFKKFFSNDHSRNLWELLAQKTVPWKDLPDFYRWAGFHQIPELANSDLNLTYRRGDADLKDIMADDVMGATIIHRSINGEKVRGLTFSCAGCHSSNLFGEKILGLTNRFPRANELFFMAKKMIPFVNTFFYREILSATRAEGKMFEQTKKSLNYVGVKEPLVLGLDTSLAQVGLSLSLRGQDADASLPNSLATSDQEVWWENEVLRQRKILSHHPMNQIPADSKPMVWWNTKYKTKFLSDGSLVAGNPIFTNILWNEIGRGTDLKLLSKWIEENQLLLQELTHTVFNTKAPKYVNFFGRDSINVVKAQKGEQHFIQSCQKCHGSYEKDWNTLNTTKVTYHEVTPVIDVGTDPYRYEGIKYFSDTLNKLNISKLFGTIVEPQKGYVPPPLEGIWARFPYMHNNSIPNLCALLTQTSSRPKSFYTGEARDKKTDFDSECVGYPIGEQAPVAWKSNKESFVDTTKLGMGNMGHDKKIFLTSEGVEKFTTEEKSELIEFLKTL